MSIFMICGSVLESSSSWIWDSPFYLPYSYSLVTGLENLYSCSDLYRNYEIRDKSVVLFNRFIFSHLSLFTSETPQAGFCPDYYDSVLCWPKTPLNATASLSCPDEIFGIMHMTKYNVTRMCQENGTWSKANYSGCSPLVSAPIEHNISEWHLMSMYYLYWVGYSSSLFFLLIALAIFLHYKSLWCLRNIIHTNLISCFTLHNAVWVVYAIVAHEVLTKHMQKDRMDYCIVPTMIIKYFTVSGFFWMFVEGIFLFISIMFSLHTNRIRFWMCALLGWGIPLVLISMTALVYSKTDTAVQCWMEQYQLSYIYTIPVLVVLCTNVVFLLIIMYVVFNRLQITVHLEAVKYKKAIKALLILSPLLGVNYFIVVFQAPSDTMWIRIFVNYFNTLTSSFQGLLVAVFFCFRNNEVKNCLRKSICRWTRGHKRPSGSTFKESLKSDTHDIELMSHLIKQHQLTGFNFIKPKGKNAAIITHSNLQSVHSSSFNSNSTNNGCNLKRTGSFSSGNRVAYTKLNSRQNVVVVGSIGKSGKVKMKKFDSTKSSAGITKKISGTKQQIARSSTSSSSRHSSDGLTVEKNTRLTAITRHNETTSIPVQSHFNNNTVNNNNDDFVENRTTPFEDNRATQFPATSAANFSSQIANVRQSNSNLDSLDNFRNPNNGTAPKRRSGYGNMVPSDMGVPSSPTRNGNPFIQRDLFDNDACDPTDNSKLSTNASLSRLNNQGRRPSTLETDKNYFHNRFSREFDHRLPVNDMYCDAFHQDCDQAYAAESMERLNLNEANLADNDSGIDSTPIDFKRNFSVIDSASRRGPPMAGVFESPAAAVKEEKHYFSDGDAQTDVLPSEGVSFPSYWSVERSKVTKTFRNGTEDFFEGLVRSPDSHDSGIHVEFNDACFKRENDDGGELPPDWERCEDADGHYYYWHVKSGMVQRHRPSPLVAGGIEGRLPRTVSTDSASVSSTPADRRSPRRKSVTLKTTYEDLDFTENGHVSSNSLKRSSSRRCNDNLKLPIRFAVRSLGWTEVNEEDLKQDRSSRAVNRAIIDLSTGRKDIIDNVSKWGDGKELILELDDRDLRLIDPDTGATLHTQQIHQIRVWGVGRDNGRDFAYVARDRSSRRYMCHVFRCDTPARTIANTLRDICKRLMLERRPSSFYSSPGNNGHCPANRRSSQQQPEKSASTTFASSTLGSKNGVPRSSSGGHAFQNGFDSFPTPIEEPKKVIRCHFLGITQVSKSTGIDVLNEAVDRLVQQVRQDRWILCDVSISPSTITITEVGNSQLAECRVRYLSFLGIGHDIKQCAFIMQSSLSSFMCYVFHVEPSAGAMAKTIEAACKLRYQKVLDAHGERQPSSHKGWTDTLRSVLGNFTGRKTSRPFSMYPR